MPGSFTLDIGRTSTSVETGFLSQALKVVSIWNTAKKKERMTATIHNDLDHTELELEMKLRPAREEASKKSFNTPIRRTFLLQIHFKLCRIVLE